jgi:hypothetical protein
MLSWKCGCAVVTCTVITPLPGQTSEDRKLSHVLVICNAEISDSIIIICSYDL